MFAVCITSSLHYNECSSTELLSISHITAIFNYVCILGLVEHVSDLSSWRVKSGGPRSSRSVSTAYPIQAACDPVSKVVCVSSNLKYSIRKTIRILK